MSINVTPIPRLIDLAAPAFTLGTANAAGSAATAVASDSTLLAFDAVAPAAVAAAAVVGTSTVTARRDHVHPGTTGAGTVVDEAITRFNGTGGASLQGYSSLSPTISDAGIVSLTSGALQFPASAIASSNANTLDDYEEGTWTPTILDDPGGNGAGYLTGKQIGQYTKIGTQVYLSWTVRLDSISGMTGGNTAVLAGIPFTPRDTPDLAQVGATIVQDANLGSAAAVVVQVVAGTLAFNLQQFDTNAGTTEVTVTEFSASGSLRGSVSYPV
jgi:hypothetical protein